MAEFAAKLIRLPYFYLPVLALALSVALPASAAQPLPGVPTLAPLIAQVTPAVVNISIKSRSAAEDNPLLLADVGFYETELAATRRCSPSVAVVTRPVR